MKVFSRLKGYFPTTSLGLILAVLFVAPGIAKEGDNTEGMFKRADMECEPSPVAAELGLPDCLPGDIPDRISFESDGIKYSFTAYGEGVAKVPSGVASEFSVPLSDNTWIETVFYSKILNDLVLMYKVTDGDSGAYKLCRFTTNPLNMKWTIHIPAFNPGTPLLDSRYLYVTGIGFVAKLDITNGTFAWKHEGLFKRNPGTFNMFAVPVKEDGRIVFRDLKASEAGGEVPPEATIVVDDETGQILN